MRIICCAALSLTAAPTFAWDGERFAVCNLGLPGATEAVLRAEPRADAASVMNLAEGTHLEAEHPDPQNGWREVIVQEDPATVSYSGPAGWVHMEFLCRTAP